MGQQNDKEVNEGMQKILRSSDSEDEELCPFCKQNLQSSDIIACYEAYFSDNYTKLKETIEDYRKSLSADHSEEVQLAFEDAIQEVKQKIKF